MIEPGIFAKTFPGSNPDQCLQAVKEHGLYVAHYNMACSGLPAMPDEIAQGVVDGVREASRKYGVKLIGISGTFNMIHPETARRAKGLERLQILALAAQAIEIPLITLCTGTRDPEDKWRAHPDNNRPDAWKDLCASMENALMIAEEHDVLLGIEPELANVVDSAVKAKRLLDEMASPRLRIVFDPANLFETAPLQEQRRLIDEGLELLADQIVMAHAKDRTADGAFCVAGQGILDYPHYIQALKSYGFEGPLVLHGLEEGEVEGCARFLGERI